MISRIMCPYFIDVSILMMLWASDSERMTISSEHKSFYQL